MAAYEVRQYELIQGWLDDNGDPVACRAMATWMAAALTGPKNLANGVLTREGRGRRLYFAVVPGTNAMVTYLAGDLPVRVMTIVSVIPAP